MMGEKRGTRAFFTTLLIGLLLISACATHSPKLNHLDKSKGLASDAQANSQADESQTEVTTVKPKGDSENASASEIENLTIDDVIRIEEPNTQNLYDNSRYDFPITMNSRVEGWIDYFTGRGRSHMERYLSRSSRYLPIMKQIFKKAGLPEDLVYLALIESGFNLRAKSRARAVGPWQFMRGTGKRYGLRIDAWIDERRDPIRSTEAAANYLKDLYLMFESWYLAASAYNAGEYKILRAIEQTKTNNFWRICQTHLLRRETKDYIPKLIAAAIIGKNPARYGFSTVDYQQPLEYETVSIDFPAQLKDVAQAIDIPEDDLYDLNPSFTRDRVPPSGGSYAIRVPVGTRVLIEKALSSLRAKTNLADLPMEYVVHAGETLSRIAGKFHLSRYRLANLNNLSPRERLSPGASILIPVRARGLAGHHSNRPHHRTLTSLSPEEGQFLVHVVRRGESLWSISEKYDVTVQSIFRWNHLKHSRLHPGERLRIKAARNADQTDGALARPTQARPS